MPSSTPSLPRPKLLLRAAGAVLALLAATPAQAIIAQNSGLANPAYVVTFGANVLPNFTPISTEFPPLTITHANYYTTGSYNNLVGGFLTNDFSGAPNTLRLQFALPVTDVSFVYQQISTSAPSTIRAMFAGVQVDSFSGTWNQTQPNNYFGFTNTLLDEVQIDFVGDFNVDTVAFNGPAATTAQCVFANGSGINPADFTCATLPSLGATWQGVMTMNANTLATLLAYSDAGLGAPVPIFGGELLLNLSTPLLLFSGAGTYSLPIPSAPSWIGTTLTFQGVRVELVAGSLAIVPLNANTLVVGL